MYARVCACVWISTGDICEVSNGYCGISKFKLQLNKSVVNIIPYYGCGIINRYSPISRARELRNAKKWNANFPRVRWPRSSDREVIRSEKKKNVLKRLSEEVACTCPRVFNSAVDIDKVSKLAFSVRKVPGFSRADTFLWNRKNDIPCRCLVSLAFSSALPPIYENRQDDLYNILM